MDNGLRPRIGTFLILVGCAFLILFIGAISVREFHILYLILAIAASFLGFVLRSSAPPPESTRFSSLRKVRQQSSQRRNERAGKGQRNKPVRGGGIFGAGRRECEHSGKQRENGTDKNQEK